MRFRETSKIVTFYTRRYGKLAAVAKGARETKSKYGAALEPMTAVGLVLYKKDHRDLQLVSECDIRKRYKNIHSEMDRMAVGLSILELLHQLTHDEEENPRLFSLVEETLDALESASGNIVNYQYGFELRLCAIHGFAPAFDRCVQCYKQVDVTKGGESVIFQFDKGGMLCPTCAEAVPSARLKPLDARDEAPGKGPAYRRIRTTTVQVMERLYSAQLHSLAGLEYQGVVGNELAATLRSYLRYHFESVRPLKSALVFEQMSNDH
jgi:DNA repair protein RecO (recombination protein O)